LPDSRCLFPVLPTIFGGENKMLYSRILERVTKSAQQGKKRNKKFENMKI
jgi:hypothetical protein